MQPEQIQLHSSSVRIHRVYLGELLRRSCQPWWCRESVSLAGSSFSCLFPSNSWTLKNPADSRQVQNAALMRLWAKHRGRGGWKPKVMQHFPRSCINLHNVYQVKKKKTTFKFDMRGVTEFSSWFHISEVCDVYLLRGDKRYPLSPLMKLHNIFFFFFEYFTENSQSYTMHWWDCGTWTHPFLIRIQPLLRYSLICCYPCFLILIPVVVV